MQGGPVHTRGRSEGQRWELGMHRKRPCFPLTRVSRFNQISKPVELGEAGADSVLPLSRRN